jgi:hypothetical protein
MKIVQIILDFWRNQCYHIEALPRGGDKSTEKRNLKKEEKSS